MRYWKVDWIHTSPNEPVALYAELDDDGWEVRKIDVYDDGRHAFASQDVERGSRLGTEPWPPVAEIAADLQFRPHAVTAEQFEQVWRVAMAKA